MYGCACGERFDTAAAAMRCRKCRQYLATADYLGRSVLDLRTGKAVAGERARDRG